MGQGFIDVPLTPKQRQSASQRGLMTPGNVDLYAQPEVKNPDGSRSTVDSSSYNLDGREYLLPSVTPDGRHLRTPDEIVGEFKKTGRHLGVFSDPASATAYAKQLHDDYAAGKYRRQPDTPAYEDAPIAPPQKLVGVGIQTVSDEQWKAMTPQERLEGILKAAGYGLSSMFGMGEAGRDAVDHPKTTLATAVAEPLVAAGVNKIPRFTRASQNFETVMGAAERVPVNLDEAGKVALRIHEIADRGTTLPSPVRKFIDRITNPNKAPMEYRELRDWASNISGLSAKDWQSVNAKVGGQIHELRMALNKAAENAARSVGKGETYTAAMKEYAQAARLREGVQDAKKVAIKSLPWAVGGGLGSWTLGKLLNLATDGR